MKLKIRRGIFSCVALIFFSLLVSGCTEKHVSEKEKNTPKQLAQEKYRVREPQIKPSLGEDRKPYLKIASESLEFPPVSGIAKMLVQAGWPLVAAKILKQNHCKDFQANFQVGIALGDPGSFWASKPDNLSDEWYWKLNFPRLTENEGRWRILSVWPEESPSSERLMFLFTNLLFRPNSESYESFYKALGDAFPRFCRKAFLACLPLFRPFFPFQLITMIIIPAESANFGVKFMRAATFLSHGFSWEVVRNTLSEFPPRFDDVFFTWSIAARDVKTAVAYLKNPESSPWNQMIKDYLLSMDPSEFEKIYGSSRVFQRMRYRALLEVELFVKENFTNDEKKIDFPVSANELQLLVASGGNDISSLTRMLPSQVSAFIMHHGGKHIFGEKPLIMFPKQGPMEYSSGTKSFDFPQNQLDTIISRSKGGEAAQHRRPAQVFPFLNLMGNSPQTTESQLGRKKQ
ncbi:hypothetical protein HYY75_11780 [bacterium]|nr:hypothetical protein [bacterium]